MSRVPKNLGIDIQVQRAALGHSQSVQYFKMGLSTTCSISSDAVIGPTKPIRCSSESSLDSTLPKRRMTEFVWIGRNSCYGSEALDSLREASALDNERF